MAKTSKGGLLRRAGRAWDKMTGSPASTAPSSPKPSSSALPADVASSIVQAPLQNPLAPPSTPVTESLVPSASALPPPPGPIPSLMVPAIRESTSGGATAWSGLRTALRALRSSTESFSPLHTVVGGFQSVLEPLENRKEYENHVSRSIKSRPRRISNPTANTAPDPHPPIGLQRPPKHFPYFGFLFFRQSADSALASKKAIRAQVQQDVKDYIHSRDIDRAIASLELLSAKYRYLFIIELVDTLLENGEEVIVPAEKLVAAIRNRRALSLEGFQRGLLPMIEMAHYLNPRVPETYQWLARLIIAAGFDRGEVEALADKILVPGKLNVQPKYVLMQEYGKATGTAPAESSSNVGAPTSQEGNIVSDSTPRPGPVPPGDRFAVGAGTPVPLVIDHFKQALKIRDYTLELKSAYIQGTSKPGGFADVYAVTLPGDRKLAVKCVRQRYLTGNDKTLKRTARELEAWSRLKHDNILELFGLAMFNDRLSMVSLWMELGTIIEFVKHSPNADRYKLVQEVVGGIAYLHSEGVVHGDIKAENILMSHDMKPKVADFGLTLLSANKSRLQLSSTDASTGSARWMAPEFYQQGGRRSKETDVYALGMTMLQIFTGEPPFSELKNEWEVLDAVRSGRRIPSRPEYLLPNSRRKDGFWEVMTRCWVYEPAQRAKISEVEQLVAKALAESGRVKAGDECSGPSTCVTTCDFGDSHMIEIFNRGCIIP